MVNLGALKESRRLFWRGDQNETKGISKFRKMHNSQNRGNSHNDRIHENSHDRNSVVITRKKIFLWKANVMQLVERPERLMDARMIKIASVRRKSEGLVNQKGLAITQWPHRLESSESRLETIETIWLDPVKRTAGAVAAEQKCVYKKTWHWKIQLHRERILRKILPAPACVHDATHRFHRKRLLRPNTSLWSKWMENES